MTLSFDQRGSTWLCRETNPSFPVTLMARNVYYGTDRLPTTLTLARGAAQKAIIILTGHVDLLVAGQRKNFAKEAGSRLHKGSSTDSEDVLQQSVTSMVDALLEKLLAAQNEVEIYSAGEIEIPDDLTPPYALWPIVPVSRAGMLLAPSQTGKSGTALMMGITVATGKTILEKLQPKTEGPVIYVGQEESREQWQARVRMIERGHEIQTPKHLYYMRLKGGSLIDSADLLSEVASFRKVKLIIVDSVQATWGSGGDNVREYASRWFNALEQIGVPILLVEHPNLEGTRKPTGDMLAAGTSVKRDRVGHAWQLRSTSIEPAPGQPWRYHMTLSDTKRNYVAKQADIDYEMLIFRYDWIKFNEAEAMSADTVVDGSSATDLAVAAVLRQDPPAHEDDNEETPGGWLVTDIVKALGAKDDRRPRQALNADYWRPADWAPHTKFRFSKVEGTGTNPVFNPARWSIDIEQGVEMPSAPGGGAETSS